MILEILKNIKLRKEWISLEERQSWDVNGFTQLRARQKDQLTGIIV